MITTTTATTTATNNNNNTNTNTTNTLLIDPGICFHATWFLLISSWLTHRP
jgi:hypothetical protein